LQHYVESNVISTITIVHEYHNNRIGTEQCSAKMSTFDETMRKLRKRIACHTISDEDFACKEWCYDEKTLGSCPH